MYYNYNSLFNSFFNNFDSYFHSFLHRKVVPTTTSTGTDVNLGINASYTVKTSGLNIHGNTGNEKVTIAQNIHNIKVDATVESVTLQGVNYDPTLLVSSAGSLAVKSTANTLATLNITANHNESLTFANASGTLSIDSTGNGIFNLSEIQLNKNQSFIATNNDMSIYGNSGLETVTLAHGVTGASISSTVEKVVLDGKSTDYTYIVDGGSVVVTDVVSGNDVAYIGVNNSSIGSQIQFTDKTLTASWNLTGGTSWNGWNSWGVTVTDPTAPVTPTTITGGTNLKYSVDFSQANLGTNLANVEGDVQTALNNIGKYISSQSTFNLQIVTEQTSPKTLAETTSSMVATTGVNGVTQETTFIANLNSNTNAGTPDATLYINLADLNQMSFSGTPSTNQYDLTSILTHEILHGMAFTGNLDAIGGAKTPYDALVNMQNNTPTFTGIHAESANPVTANTPVPLDPASAGNGSAYYHVVIPNDLMSDAIPTGVVRTISPLDVAMLQDMGVTIVGVPPVVTTLV